MPTDKSKAQAALRVIELTPSLPLVDAESLLDSFFTFRSRWEANERAEPTAKERLQWLQTFRAQMQNAWVALMETDGRALFSVAEMLERIAPPRQDSQGTTEQSLRWPSCGFDMIDFVASNLNVLGLAALAAEREHPKPRRGEKPLDPHRGVVADLAAIYEYLTGLKAQRKVGTYKTGEYNKDTGPFWQFVSVCWRELYGPDEPGASHAVKEWWSNRAEEESYFVRNWLRNKDLFGRPPESISPKLLRFTE